MTADTELYEIAARNSSLEDCPLRNESESSDAAMKDTLSLSSMDNLSIKIISFFHSDSFVVLEK